MSAPGRLDAPVADQLILGLDAPPPRPAGDRACGSCAAFRAVASARGEAGRFGLCLVPVGSPARPYDGLISERARCADWGADAALRPSRARAAGGGSGRRSG